jgi:hypothetical protein
MTGVILKRWGFVAALLVALLGVVASPAAARAKVLTLHPKWHRVDSYYSVVQTSGPWVLLGEVTSQTAGTLINQRTGAKRSVPLPSGCQDPPSLGATSLVFGCGNDVTVVSLSTGASHVIPINSQLVNWQNDCQDNLNEDDEYSCGLSVNGIGRDWIEFDESCGEHCLEAPAKPDTYVFQNIGTGAVWSDPTRGFTYADVNTPGLARRLCSPLRFPKVPEAFVDASGEEQPGLGSVEQDGRFAVVAGGEFGDTYDLEKCGSKLRQVLHTVDYPPPVYNSNVVVWEIRNEVRSKCGTQGEFDGLFLPDRRKFIVCVPSALFSAMAGDPDEIVLSQLTLFVHDEDGPLWAAPAPVEPGRKASRK